MKKLLKLEHAVILVLSLMGLYLRVQMIKSIPTVQLYDFGTYYEIADNLYHNLGYTFRGFPIAFQGMGYSTILGYWFKFIGDNSEITAKWLNVLMSMGTIYIVYYMLHKMTKNKFIIMASTIAVIFLPNHIAYCNTIGTEVMSAFFLSGIIAIQVTDFNWKIKYPVLGIAVGIISLTKPFFLVYPIILAMVEWLKNKDKKESIKLLLITTLVMMIVIAPWTMRNYKKFDRFIPVSYNSGFNLYINNNENNVHGGWQSFDDIYKTPALQKKIDDHLNNPLKSVKIASDIELDFKPAAQKWIKENPLEFLKLGIIRIHSTYFNGTWDIEYWAMNEYRTTLNKESPDDEKEITRHFNYKKSANDMILYIISAFGLMFIILNLKNILGALFTKKRVNLLNSITFLNLSFVSAVYFVYEGQPRYNFIVLFLLIVATTIMISTYQNNKEIK